MDDPELTTESVGRNYTLPVKRPQKRHCRASSVGTSQTCTEVILATPRKAKLGHYNKPVAPPSSKMGLFDYAQDDLLPVGCTEEAHFENCV